MIRVVSSAKSLSSPAWFPPTLREAPSPATLDPPLPRQYPRSPAFPALGIVVPRPQPWTFVVCDFLLCLPSGLWQPFNTHRSGVLSAV